MNNKSKAKNPQPAKVRGAQGRIERVWINSTWYVEVDERGYVRRSDEGTLGCVLQLRKDDDPKSRLALKIPRLLADTVKENAYICEITKDEVQNVQTAHNEDHDGLLTSQLIQSNVVALPRETQHSPSIDPSAKAQHDHVVFVQFDKRFRPRLCCVRFDNGELSVFPAGAKNDIAAFIDENIWDDLTKSSKDAADNSFAEPVFVAKSPSGDRVGCLPTEMQLERIEKAWFAGLPSVTFGWAVGTLQQALGTNALASWQVEHFFELFDRIMEGTVTLHRKGLLHCDLRPANIMGIGTLTKPDSFYVGDYGSFSIDKARVAGGPSGHTMIGPGIGGTRATPFYSEERRSGVERETADTAVILRDEKSGTLTEYIVRLGWSAEIFVGPDGEIDQDKAVTDEVRRKIIEESEGIDQDGSSEMSDDALMPGDRLRLRDYIFEIIGGRSLGSRGLVARCHKKFAHVVHDKLAVYDREIEGEHGQTIVGIADGTVMSLPSFTEYRQWSVATDMYGVGALTLYSLFYSAMMKHEKDVERERNIEAKFSEMLKILESKPYFQSFWEDLRHFTVTVDKLISKYGREQIPAGDASEYPVEGRDNVSLREFAVKAVNNIVQSAPHVRVLLEPFRPIDSDEGAREQFNVAGFLLFMHFAMGCLHRRSHLKTANDDSIPFCKNRIEMPSKSGDVSGLAVNAARIHLKKVKALLAKEWLGVFCVDAKKIPEFSPRNEFNIRIERAAWMHEAEAAMRLPTGSMGGLGKRGAAAVTLADKMKAVLENERRSEQSQQTSDSMRHQAAVEQSSET